DPGEQKRFFEESYKLFSERYGKQNIAYATVHNDEQTPHMHLGVVPMRDGKLQGKDRKSTRLNSSHVSISYAVFCLKKKNLSLTEQAATAQPLKLPSSACEGRQTFSLRTEQIVKTHSLTYRVSHSHNYADMTER